MLAAQRDVPQLARLVFLALSFFGMTMAMLGVHTWHCLGSLVGEYYSCLVGVSRFDPFWYGDGDGGVDSDNDARGAYSTMFQ